MTNKIFHNDDIPYEQRMKYIIEAYKKDQEKWAKMESYTKNLEKEMERMRTEYETQIEELKNNQTTKRKELTDKEVVRLRNLIEKDYPLRKYRVRALKDIIRSQKEYIEELQNLLDEHDIIYCPKVPANELELERIENIDENAIRQKGDIIPSVL